MLKRCSVVMLLCYKLGVGASRAKRDRFSGANLAKSVTCRHIAPPIPRWRRDHLCVAPAGGAMVTLHRMGDWYVVTKTIRGRRYLYRQRTRREGKAVRTENKYLGPVDRGDSTILSKINQTCHNRLSMFIPDLKTLPLPQRMLWPELASTPETFTLYGGTAIALRLGHRVSVDFDFFSPDAFAPARLMEQIPYLVHGTLRQSEPNTLTVTVERGGPVQVSFFGGLRLGQIEPPDIVEGPRFKVAPLIDLAGLKIGLITQRAELKDYLDIHAMMTRAGISIATMLAAGSLIYGEQFNALTSLKALTFFQDGDLEGLPSEKRKDLIEAVRAVDVTNLPLLTPHKRKPPRL